MCKEFSNLRNIGVRMASPVMERAGVSLRIREKRVKRQDTILLYQVSQRDSNRLFYSLDLNV